MMGVAFTFLGTKRSATATGGGVEAERTEIR